MKENIKTEKNGDDIKILKLKKTQESYGSSCSKLRGLIKKNLLILKRNKLTTLCEILFPIILMLLMLVVRKQFLIEENDFIIDEKTTSNFISRRSLANVDMDNDDIIPNEDNTSFYWHNLSILPALRICSKSNRRNEERPLIGSIGIPLSIKERIIMDASFYKEKIGMNFTLENFKEFKDINDMNSYVKDKKFGTEENPGICFGIKFEENKWGYNYSLHYFDSIFDKGIQDLSNIIGGPIDLFKSGPDMQSYQRYRSSGYTYIMKIVNEYILKKETKNVNAKLNFGMMPMKYVNYRRDKLGDYMAFIIPFFIMVAYICSLCLYVYRMVSEKESRAKEGMKIMGLGEGIYFFSYFLQYLVINIFVSVINTVIVIYVFTKIPFYFIFILFFLWGMNIFALAFFFQSFIDSTKIALILSLLIYFVMYFASLASIQESSSQGLKIGLSFLPPAALEITIVLFGEFESHFRQFKPRYFTNIYTNYSLLRMLIMFVVDFFIYSFLGYYLTMVLPHTYGIRKPFYFLFTPEFWCGKNKDPNKSTISTSEDNSIKSPTVTNSITASNLDIILYNSKTASLPLTEEKNPNFESEELYSDRIGKDDALRIRNLTKKFEDGKIAVNNLNLICFTRA